MNVQPLPVCYRHHDRETRLACANCARPICVDCVRFADVGQRCPECAPPPPETAAAGATGLTAASGARSPVSFGILGVCVALFGVGLFVPELRFEFLERGSQANPLVSAGETWRLFTAAFLHADLTHVLFNMWALYLFGPPLERETGSAPFAVMYFASVAAGGALFHALEPSGVAIGASGAIFGLFGAWLAAAVRNRRDPRGRAGLRQLLVLLGINVALPLFVPQIAWQAHLGGFLAGFLIALLWMAAQRRGASAVTRTVLAATVGLLAFATVL